MLIEELTIEGSDYHINTGSAAIAQGDVTVLAEFAELTSDFDGQARLLYAVDLGADQITAGPVERIVDNLDPGTSSVGIWNPSSTLGFWATNAVFSNVLGNTFTFPATLAPETPYAVYAWWTAASNRSTAVTILTVGPGGTSSTCADAVRFVPVP